MGARISSPEYGGYQAAKNLFIPLSSSSSLSSYMVSAGKGPQGRVLDEDKDEEDEEEERIQPPRSEASISLRAYEPNPLNI